VPRFIELAGKMLVDLDEITAVRFDRMEGPVGGRPDDTTAPAPWSVLTFFGRDVYANFTVEYPTVNEGRIAYEMLAHLLGLVAAIPEGRVET
jgi:hypothetical protein